MKKMLFLISMLILLYCVKKEDRLAFDSQTYRAVSVPDLIVKQNFLYDVRAYGAESDDSGNDVSYIQAAIDSASSQGGGVVYLHAGTWNIDTLINMKTGVGLLGAGRDLTTIQCDSAYDALHFGDGGTTAMGRECFVRDLTIDGNSTGVHGMVFEGAATDYTYYTIFNDISDVTIANFDSFGIYLKDYCFSNSFTRVYMLQNYHGAYLYSRANNISFRECDISGSDSTGILVEGNFECVGVLITDQCQFDGNDRAIDITGDCRWAVIRDCYFENNSDTTIVWRPSSAYFSNILIDGNYMSGNNANSSVAIACSTGATITNNHITQGAVNTYDDAGIVIDTLSTDIYMYGNYFNSGGTSELVWDNRVSKPYFIIDEEDYLEFKDMMTLQLNADDNNFKTLKFSNDDTARWYFRMLTESGGADLQFQRYDSDGNLAENVLLLDWTTGNLTINDSLDAYGSANVVVKDTAEFDYKVDIQDSVRLGASSAWIRKIFWSTTGESLGVVSYNTVSTKLDTGWLTTK